MADEREISSVNLLDLDIQELEERLEMVHPVFHPDGYKCGVDCQTYRTCGGYGPIPEEPN